MNKKLKGKSIKYRSVDICTKPIRTLAKCFDEGNYFKVILLAPQVYEQLLEEISRIQVKH